MKKGVYIAFVTVLFSSRLTAQVSSDTSLKAFFCPSKYNFNSPDSIYSNIAIDRLCCSDSSYTITSYTLSMTVKGDLHEYNIKENMITSEIVKNLNLLQKGDKIYFSNIKAKSPEGKTVKLKSLKYTIQ